MSGKNKGGREIRKPKQVKTKAADTAVVPLVRKSPPKKSG